MILHTIKIESINKRNSLFKNSSQEFFWKWYILWYYDRVWSDKITQSAFVKIQFAIWRNNGTMFCACIGCEMSLQNKCKGKNCMWIN